MAAALELGRHDPDLVAVEARRHLAAPPTHRRVALPAAASAAPPAGRPAPTPPAPRTELLHGYDELLRDDLLDDELLTGKATA